MTIYDLKSTIIKNSIFRKKVVKDFVATAGSNIALVPLGLIKEFFVAKFLGPADYGILKSLELIQMLNKYGSLGFNSVVLREAGDAIGKGEKEKEKLVRNTNYSAEIILSLMLFIIGIISSLFIDSTEISLLIVLSTIGLLAMKIRGIFNTEASLQKRFVLISKVTFITTTIGYIVIIIIVPFLKIYAVVLLNIVTGVIAIFLFGKRININYKFDIDKTQLKKSFAIGIPTILGTLSLGGYKYAERILTLSYFDEVYLGYLGFGFMISNILVVFFKSLVSVSAQDIFEYIGQSEFKKVHQLVKRNTILIVICGVVSIPVVWLSLDIFVPLLLDKWVGGIGIAKIIAFYVPIIIIHDHANVVVISSLVDKIRIIPVIQVIAIVLFIAAAFLMSHFELLNFETFLYINLTGYSIYHFSILFLYKKYFYNVYIKAN